MASLRTPEGLFTGGAHAYKTSKQSVVLLQDTSTYRPCFTWTLVALLIRHLDVGRGRGQLSVSRVKLKYTCYCFPLEFYKYN